MALLFLVLHLGLGLFMAHLLLFSPAFGWRILWHCQEWNAMNDDQVFVTNIVTIAGTDYRIIGKTIVGMLGGWKVINVETGGVSIVRINSQRWEFIG